MLFEKYKITFINLSCFPPGMAKDNRIRLPSSTAGITSFYNDVKTNFEISPWTVIVIIGIIAVLEIILQIAF